MVLHLGLGFDFGFFLNNEEVFVIKFNSEGRGQIYFSEIGSRQSKISNL
jgi:hypothetical protein